MIGSYKTIVDYYTDVFELKRYGGFTLPEINGMFPYEMEIYSYQVLKAIKDENEKIKNARNRR